MQIDGIGLNLYQGFMQTLWAQGPLPMLYRSLFYANTNTYLIYQTSVFDQSSKNAVSVSNWAKLL